MELSSKLQNITPTKLSSAYWVCRECGEHFGHQSVHTKNIRWIGMGSDESPDLRTRCSVCGHLAQVTEKRNYNMLQKGKR